MLNCVVNPATVVTAGRVKAAAQVLAGAVMTGAAGNMTTLTVLPVPHDPVPAVPAVVLPQADVKTYFAAIVWQPVVVGIVGEAAKPPPSMLYCVVNPARVVTAGRVKADAQAFAGAVMTGAAGNMTTLTVLLVPHDPVPAVPAGVLPQADVNTYLATMV